jgi:hypothetical protein
VNGLDDANYYRWTCQGAPDAACAAEVPKCSATHSGCAPGTSQSPGTTSTNYSWNCSNASVTGVPLASCNEARPQYFTLCYQNGGSGWVDVTTLSNSVVSVLKGGTVSLKALYGPNRNCSEAVNENSNVSLDASTKWDISPEDAGGNGTVSNYSGVKKIVFDTFYRASKGMRNKMDITVSTSKSVQAGSSNQHSISFSIGCTQTTGVCGSTEKINNTCLGEVYFATDTLCDNTPVTCSGGKRDCGSGYQEVAP